MATQAIFPKFTRFKIDKDSAEDVTGQLLVSIPEGGAFHGGLIRRVQRFGLGDVDAVVRTVGAVGSEVSMTLLDTDHNENQVHQLFAEAGPGGMSVILDLNVPGSSGIVTDTYQITAADYNANKVAIFLDGTFNYLNIATLPDNQTFQRFKATMTVAVAPADDDGVPNAISKLGIQISTDIGLLNNRFGPWQTTPWATSDVVEKIGLFKVRGTGVPFPIGATNFFVEVTGDGVMDAGSLIDIEIDRAVVVPGTIANQDGALYIDVHFDA